MSLFFSRVRRLLRRPASGDIVVEGTDRAVVAKVLK